MSNLSWGATAFKNMSLPVLWLQSLLLLQWKLYGYQTLLLWCTHAQDVWSLYWMKNPFTRHCKAQAFPRSAICILHVYKSVFFAQQSSSSHSDVKSHLFYHLEYLSAQNGLFNWKKKITSFSILNTTTIERRNVCGCFCTVFAEKSPGCLFVQIRNL